MNETSRCCRVLGVKHGASLEEVKKTYRDLVQVWHPDRFSGNERLQAKAQEQLKEINLAFDYLVANAFQDGLLVEPAVTDLTVAPATADQPEAAQPPLEESPASGGEAAASPWSAEEAEIREEPESRTAFWALIALLVVLVGCGMIWLLQSRARTHGVAAAPQPVGSSSYSAQPMPPPPAATTSTPPPQIASAYPFSKDILPDMTSTNGGDWLQGRCLLSPPFVIRAKLKLTDLADTRLYYALGRVIFNWADNPEELRVHDPRNWNITPVSDQGVLSSNETHEVVWEITTSNMSVRVDGKLRYKTRGNYAGIEGFPGIGPWQGPVNLESFVLETPQQLKNRKPSPRGHGPVADDILSSMVAEPNVRVSDEPDGRVLRIAGGEGNRLMSRETFRPPFTVTTRAQTDGLNLRLYCGAGELIFNWEANPQELRVHDPLTGQQYPVPEKGLVSPNEWHTFIWKIQPTGMLLWVDGQPCIQNHVDYHALDANVGIGPAMSMLKVDYFAVTKQ